MIIIKHDYFDLSKINGWPWIWRRIRDKNVLLEIVHSISPIETAMFIQFSNAIYMDLPEGIPISDVETQLNEASHEDLELLLKDLNCATQTPLYANNDISKLRFFVFQRTNGQTWKIIAEDIKKLDPDTVAR